MSSVNICLKYITFRQILLDKIFLFPDPIRFKTVVLYRAKQTDDVLGYGKTDHIGVSDTGNNSRICH